MSEMNSESLLLERWRLLSVIARDAGLSRTDIAVANVILDAFNVRRGYAWPGKATIAKAVGATERAVKKSLTRLQEAGYFEIVRSKGGRRVTNKYLPNWNAIDEYENPCSSGEAPEKGEPHAKTGNARSGFSRSHNTETGNNRPRNGEQSVLKTGNARSPEPTYKPNYKPTYRARERTAEPPPRMTAPPRPAEPLVARQVKDGVNEPERAKPDPSPPLSAAAIEAGMEKVRDTWCTLRGIDAIRAELFELVLSRETKAELVRSLRGGKLDDDCLAEAEREADARHAAITADLAAEMAKALPGGTSEAWSTLMEIDGTRQMLDLIRQHGGTVGRIRLRTPTAPGFATRLGALKRVA